MKQEANLQAACVRWFRYQFPTLSKVLIHVPNGGSRNAREALNLKIQGVMPGCADLLLLAPRNGFGCLAIEIKAGKNGQSELQKDWQKCFEKMGNKYVLCRNIDDFMEETTAYLHSNQQHV